jgi:hypothetical protein
MHLVASYETIGRAATYQQEPAHCGIVFVSRRAGFPDSGSVVFNCQPSATKFQFPSSHIKLKRTSDPQDKQIEENKPVI